MVEHRHLEIGQCGEATDDEGELVRGAIPHGGDSPVKQEPWNLALGAGTGDVESQLVEDADDGVGVADVKCEQHG